MPWLMRYGFGRTYSRVCYRSGVKFGFYESNTKTKITSVIKSRVAPAVFTQVGVMLDRTLMLKAGLEAMPGLVSPGVHAKKALLIISQRFTLQQFCFAP